MTALATQTWGSGTRVVLVHGSFAGGEEAWQAQRPLADEGFELVVPDRRGYGQSPPTDGEDFLQDADDLLDLLGGQNAVHLVGHSYGALGVLVAAARRPQGIRSIALLEPPALALAQDQPAARALAEELRRLWDTDLPDEQWLVRFLQAVGTDVGELPPGALDVAVTQVPLVRGSRPAWSPELPLDEVAKAELDKLVVSGGHSQAFDAICDDLAERIGASRAEVSGAGHEIQYAPHANEILLQLWRTAAP